METLNINNESKNTALGAVKLPENPKECFDNFIKNCQNNIRNIEKVSDTFKKKYDNMDEEYKLDFINYFTKVREEAILEGFQLAVEKIEAYKLL